MQSFYENTNVFITGGSGLLGKVIIEALIRKTEVKCIYMLIRAKEGQAAEERIQQMLAGPLFAKVRQRKPHTPTLITPIHGDCAQPNLGISEEDRKLLTANVNVVIHSAATIRFNEPLYDALLLNVRPTGHLLEMAKDMRQLKSFVFVSTAFSNCVRSHIDEEYNPQVLDISARKALKVATLLGPELTNGLTEKIVSNYPNTYTFTKALAEQLIFSESTNLPLCIFRPGIITSTHSEPEAGWIDSLAGAIGGMLAIVQGLLRVFYMNVRYPMHVAPLDFCANAILACGYRAGELENVEMKTNDAPKIYNFVPSENNQPKWGELTQVAVRHGRACPFSNRVWYPFLIPVASVELEKFMAFFLHFLPACFLDMLLLLRGEKGRMIKLLRKQNKFVKVLHYFTSQAWTFKTANTQHLWSGLSAVDQLNFNFDTSSINWDEYFRAIVFGFRQYIYDEKRESAPKAMIRLQRLKLAHFTVMALMIAFLSTVVILLARFTFNFWKL